MLCRSPPGLPFAPRVVYTSSGTATLSKLNNHPLDDYMLLDYDQSYGASKYMGDMAMIQLDREFNDETTKKDDDNRGVRVLTIEPGCVATNFFNAGLGAWVWWIKFKWFWYWLSFYIVRAFFWRAPRKKNRNKTSLTCSSVRLSAGYSVHPTTPFTLTKVPSQCSTRPLSPRHFCSLPRKYLRKSLKSERKDGATQRLGTGRLIDGKRRMGWDYPRVLRIDVKLCGESGGGGRG